MLLEFRRVHLIIENVFVWMFDILCKRIFFQQLIIIGPVRLIRRKIKIITRKVVVPFEMESLDDVLPMLIDVVAHNQMSPHIPNARHQYIVDQIASHVPVLRHLHVTHLTNFVFSKPVAGKAHGNWTNQNKSTIRIPCLLSISVFEFCNWSESIYVVFAELLTHQHLPLHSLSSVF